MIKMNSQARLLKYKLSSLFFVQVYVGIASTTPFSLHRSQHYSKC